MPAKAKEPTFEEALKSLENVVAKLESGETNLEESIRLFEEGMRLSALCQKRLDDAGRKIGTLMGNPGGGAAGAGGGKPLRPVGPLSSGNAVGGEERDLLPFACAVEYVHTYSLIHDDLPAMDDDDFRRGRPACHRAFGEAAAILAGDALLTEAFRVMGESPLAGSDPSKAVRAWALLARAAGASGIAGGQMMDLRPGAGEKTMGPGGAQASAIEEIDLKKTAGPLSPAAARGGGLGGGAGGRGGGLSRDGG